MNAGAWGVTALAAAVLFAVGAMGYDYGKTSADADWSTRWAEQVDKLGKEKTEAVESALLVERQSRAKALEVSKDAQEQNASVEIGHADSGPVADRLRIDATKLANSVSNMSHTATLADRSAAATRAAMVLSDLLDRSIQTNRELARAYDLARIAGEACERINDPP
jgi:hypothetical protein